MFTRVTPEHWNTGARQCSERGDGANKLNILHRFKDSAFKPINSLWQNHGTMVHGDWHPRNKFDFVTLRHFCLSWRGSHSRLIGFTTYTAIWLILSLETYKFNSGSIAWQSTSDIKQFGEGIKHCRRSGTKSNFGRKAITWHKRHIVLQATFVLHINKHNKIIFLQSMCTEKSMERLQGVFTVLLLKQPLFRPYWKRLPNGDVSDGQYATKQCNSMSEESSCGRIYFTMFLLAMPTKRREEIHRVT